MSSPKPTFRVMKNGYDRFAVDDSIDKYAAEVDELEKKIKIYEDRLTKAYSDMQVLNDKCRDLQTSMDAEKQAAENIARLSLLEANEIIDTAQNNADMIIRQSLYTAREILVELSRLYSDANVVKSSTKTKLEQLVKELDTFELPKMPDLGWLHEAEKKMR